MSWRTTNETVTLAELEKAIGEMRGPQGHKRVLVFTRPEDGAQYWEIDNIGTIDDVIVLYTHRGGGGEGSVVDLTRHNLEVEVEHETTPATLDLNRGLGRPGRRAEVIKALCEAIEVGRRTRLVDDWSFASDCFCRDDRDGPYFHFDDRFLRGLVEAVQEFTGNYVHETPEQEAVRLREEAANRVRNHLKRTIHWVPQSFSFNGKDITQVNLSALITASDNDEEAIAFHNQLHENEGGQPHYHDDQGIARLSDPNWGGRVVDGEGEGRS